MDRINKTDGYIEVCRSIGKRSPCARKKFGAIVVKNDTIVGTGYNGAARGALNCGTDIPCLKNMANEPHLSSYIYCSAVHAEDNAISASGWQNCFGSIMYLAPVSGPGYLPCYQCRRKILNAQIKGVYYIGEDETLKYVTNKQLADMEVEWQNGIREKFK